VVVDVHVRVDGRWGVHRSCSCSLCGRSDKVSDAMPTVDGAALPRILFHHGDT